MKIKGRSMQRSLLRTLAVLLVAAALPTLAEPIAIAQSGGVTLTLTDEPCALNGVSNLKLRAVWTEPKGSFEGCWGSQLEGQIVVLYFSDRSVMGVPGGIFKAASGL